MLTQKNLRRKAAYAKIVILCADCNAVFIPDGRGRVPLRCKPCRAKRDQQLDKIRRDKRLAGT